MSKKKVKTKTKTKTKDKRKVTLPTDRTGAPINVGDVLQWDDGTRLQVSSLTYYGSEFENIGCWSGEDEHGEFFDNLSGALIVWRKGLYRRVGK